MKSAINTEIKRLRITTQALYFVYLTFFFLFFFFYESLRKKQGIQDSIANESTPITKTQTNKMRGKLSYF